jgi:hypothetical protein
MKSHNHSEAEKHKIWMCPICKKVIRKGKMPQNYRKGCFGK